MVCFGMFSVWMRLTLFNVMANGVKNIVAGHILPILIIDRLDVVVCNYLATRGQILCLLC